MSQDRPVLTGLKRGLCRRCPNCGEGRLFRGYLKLRSPCERCGTDNARYPSDDFPPYLTIFVVAHLLVPILIWSDRAYAPPLWLQAVIWLPLIGLACVALLPFMKGATVGLCWSFGLVRQDGPPALSPFEPPAERGFKPGPTRAPLRQPEP